jgi:hypothetical protein
MANSVTGSFDNSVQFQADGASPNIGSAGGTYAPFDFWMLGFQSANPEGVIPPWWTRARDVYLRLMMTKSTILAGVVYGRSSQIRNLDWSLTADNEAMTPLLDQYQAMLETCNFGEGMRQFIHRYSLDLMTQDNGAFVELIGEGATAWYETPKGPVFAKGLLPKLNIQGFAVMDAGQCWRTYDPEYPVIYSNPYTGAYTLLHFSRVARTSQMTSNNELMRGVGLCATSRAIQAIEMMRAVDEWQYEKVTGASPNIALAANINREMLKNVSDDVRLSMDQRGLVRYKNTAFIPVNDSPGSPARIDLIKLRDVPDGWNHEQEVMLSIYAIAAAFGTDARDLGYPATQTGATKADASIQDAKAKGRGLLDLVRDIEDVINYRVLPRGLRFSLGSVDDLESARKAELTRLRVEARAMMVQTGMISLEQARELLAEEGEIPAQFMEVANVIRQDEQPTAQEEDLGAGVMPEQKSISTYTRKLMKLVNSYRKGEIDKLTFKRTMRDEIEKQFELAWRAGAREIGEPADSPGSYEVLQGLIDEELTFVQQFADAVQAATIATDKAYGEKISIGQIRERVGLWANRFSYVKNRALVFLGIAKPLEWKYGPTEHCSDCLRLNGHVALGADWQNTISPQSRGLDCGGWNCKCQLVPTSKTLTRGPIPYGGNKHRQEHSHHAPKTGRKVPAKYAKINFTPPKGVQEAAQRGLDLRSEFGRGGTAVGIARARDLSNGVQVSPSTIRRMTSYFARHAVDERPGWSNPSKPSNGYIAWLLWGGDAGRAWADKVAAQMETADNAQ